MRIELTGAAVGMASVLLLASTVAAHADDTENLRSAVNQVRAGTSCGAYRADPIAEQVADKVNNSTQKYLDHTATEVPITDPMPGLKILGYPGTRATLLQGASRDEAESIKALILQGYEKLPDCSYTDIGVSTQVNSTTGYVLTAVVLAGA